MGHGRRDRSSDGRFQMATRLKRQKFDLEGCSGAILAMRSGVGVVPFGQWFDGLASLLALSLFTLFSGV